MTDRNRPAEALPAPPVITAASRLSVGAGLRQLTTAAPASGASPFAINDLLAFPFILPVATTIYKAFWLNGTSVGANYSVGIYNVDFALLVQTASTAGAGSASLPQVAALAATIKLPPGLYYAAMASDSATTNRLFRWTVATVGASYFKMFGCWRQASVTLATLPNPATPVACNNVAFPVFGLITRTVFDV